MKIYTFLRITQLIYNLARSIWHSAMNYTTSTTFTAAALRRASNTSSCTCDNLTNMLVCVCNLGFGFCHDYIRNRDLYFIIDFEVVFLVQIFFFSKASVHLATFFFNMLALHDACLQLSHEIWNWQSSPQSSCTDHFTVSQSLCALRIGDILYPVVLVQTTARWAQQSTPPHELSQPWLLTFVFNARWILCLC